MSLLESSKFLLRKYRIVPNKFLGQNFMVESSIFQLMSDYASLDKNDIALDIGAGLGFLTRFLANKCRTVLAVEVDLKLVAVLGEQLEGLNNVKVIRGNVLKAQLPAFNKVISIPPYQISSHLLSWIFDRSFDCAVMIFQKEFASRLVASIGSEDYGWLTVLAYYHAEAELLETVQKSMFYPQPEVDSIIVRLKPRKQPPFLLNDITVFRRMVRSMFTQRNRKVRNAILPFVKGMQGISSKDAAKLVEILPFRDRRVRELASEDFGTISNAIIS
jgi:16S rRNA (adenine1518-N6/adenine1519-N6)-dimethyltransferase